MLLRFEPLRTEDLTTLARWLGTPHVTRWWPGPHDLASVTRAYQPLVDGTDTTSGFVILEDHTPIGFIQSYRIADEPDWRRAVSVAVDASDAAGIDYLIGEPGWLGRGIGSAAISQFVDLLWDRHPEVTAVVVGVQQANVASWRALERAAFKRLWSGQLDTDDPSDQGPAHLYARARDEG